MQLTQPQKDVLEIKLKDALSLFPEVIEQVNDAVIEWHKDIHPSTYSEIIQAQDGGYMRHCPTCDKSYTIWKCHFPVLMLRALRILQDSGKPMQVRDLQKELKTNWDERGKFKRLKHWKLITENPDGTCSPTEDVGMFFGGVKRVREWLWIFDDQPVEPPMDEKNGDLKYIHELSHRKITLQEIIGQSVSAFGSPPVPSEQSALC